MKSKKRIYSQPSFKKGKVEVNFFISFDQRSLLANTVCTFSSGCTKCSGSGSPIKC